MAVVKSIGRAIHSFSKYGKHCKIILSRTWSSDSEVLTRSTILLQDGIDITEVPVVLRRITGLDLPLTHKEVMPFTGEKMFQESTENKKFQEDLRACSTMSQIMELLEVPGEKIVSHKAVFALQRILHLHKARMPGNESNQMVREAVIEELCETALDDLKNLPTSILTHLVQCALEFDSFSSSPSSSVHKIDNEVETRIGDGVFSISEISELIKIYSVNIKGSISVTHNLWIHLGHRHKEIDDKNIKLVYETLQYASPEFKYIFRVLDRNIKSLWQKLNASDINTMVRIMSLCNHYSASSLMMIGRWLFLNIHEVQDEHMKDIIGICDQFNFSDTHIVRSIERYVSLKCSRMDKTLVGMVTDYFRKRRYLSPRVLDTVAVDFEVNGDQYDSAQMLKVLKPFGQLNYLPPNSGALFTKVEDMLLKHFNDFDAASMLELLASFVYIERIPLNFLRKIFIPHFLAKVLAIPNPALQQRAARHMLELQAAVLLECPQHPVLRFMVDKDSVGFTLRKLGDRYVRFHQELRDLLMEILGPDKVNVIEVPKNTPHLIDFELYVGPNEKAVMYGSNNVKRKLALIGVMPEHYCINTSHLLGEHALRKRHLKLMGYTIIELHFEEFMYKRQHQGAKWTNHKKEYLCDLLSPYIQLQK